MKCQEKSRIRLACVASVGIGEQRKTEDFRCFARAKDRARRLGLDISYQSYRYSSEGVRAHVLISLLINTVLKNSDSVLQER